MTIPTEVTDASLPLPIPALYACKHAGYRLLGACDDCIIAAQQATIDRLRAENAALVSVAHAALTTPTDTEDPT